MTDAILITGATGFIGSHLTRRLVEIGKNIILLCRRSSNTSRIADLSKHVQIIKFEKSTLAASLSGIKFTGVIHLATDYGRHGCEVKEIFNTNFILPTELLELAINTGAKYFINTDSFFCKSQFNYQFLPEYTYSKTCFLGWAQKKAIQIHIANMQLEHVYGPQDNPTKFVPNLLREILSPNSQEIKLTNGQQMRDFVFVDDVVDAYCRVINYCERVTCGFETYEVGTGHSISLREFVERMHASASSKAVLNFGAIPQRIGEIMDSKADIRSLAALGYRTKVDISLGISKLVQLARV